MYHENLFDSLDSRSVSHLAAAWEQFTGSGSVSNHILRPVISQSWQQSRELGIAHATERAPTVISAEEIEQKVKTEDLCRAGVTALEKLEDILHDTEHVVVLADAAGHILYSIGHAQIQNKLERINFMPGGAWSEQVVGANGVGTPLRLGRPEIIMGYEHYCKGWHPWVCYGAPIHSPTGDRILGAIDITGPVEKLSKEAMALALSVAQSVHSGLTVLNFHRREMLRDMARDLLRRWPDEGLLILDENGYIVEYNNQAIKFLKLDPLSFMNASLGQLLPSLEQSVTECMNQRTQIEIKLHTERDSGILHPIKVRIQPVYKGNRMIGMAIIMSDRFGAGASSADRRPEQKLPQARYSFTDIRGRSARLRAAINLARAAATDPLQSNVLLMGETGTGKELLAHAIHSESPRAQGPFIAINCAAMPRELIESELFGYTSGAFTGARRGGMKGKFESAHNGTLFLDEINSMAPDLQAKLLRVLDSMELTPVGGVEPIRVDVRVIAAANQNIFDAVDEGSFRLDLYHRLGVLEINLPALHERDKDIIDLAEEFLESECQAAGRNMLSLSTEVRELMLSYRWPGNIRELHNTCLRWVLTARGDVVGLDEVPEKIKRGAPVGKLDIGGRSLRSVSDELIRQTLEKTGNNISEAARLLGIDRATIYRRRRLW